ncbi:MAG: hypothetical protein Q8S23_02805 [Bacteroidales bacterium]|nr:hypothetical protein [Bacteroidales bacterium]
MRKLMLLIVSLTLSITLSIALLILIATPLASFAQDVNGMKLAEDKHY